MAGAKWKEEKGERTTVCKKWQKITKAKEKCDTDGHKGAKMPLTSSKTLQLPFQKISQK